MQRVVILDYDLGNVKSVANALAYLGVTPLVSRDAAEIARCDAMIIPGVGAFAAGMDRLRKYGLVSEVQRFVASRRPLLGICLGFQMFASRSTEYGIHPGLGLIDAEVKRLEIRDGGRLPHINWAGVDVPEGRSGPRSLMNGMSGELFYFVHSFGVYASDTVQSIATTNYEGTTFCSYAETDRIYGVQFHPEKSGEAGLGVLSKFIGII